MKSKLSIWDILAWLALIFIILWLLLKTLGIINTPLWLEYSPLYAAAYIAGWQINKLREVAEDVKELKCFKDTTIKEIHAIKLNCAKKHN